MEKTVDEILHALETCSDLHGTCDDCPYIGFANCVIIMSKDAADTIRALRESAPGHSFRSPTGNPRAK